MIPVYKPYLSELENNNVLECMSSTWISSKGPFISEFENKFSNFINSPNVTTVSNGTVALHLALDSIGIKPGDEIIVPALTYIASVNTILQIGAKPIYVDSIEKTFQINPNEILNKITKKTKAVMIVHLYGQSCAMEEILNICKKFNLLLIEDCAEAFGTYYRGKHVGTFGDVATFSFFGNKTITTGEGGMVVAKNTDVIERARLLKNQGVSSKKEYWHEVLAYNYRMTNICAAIGCAQISKATEILEKKRKIAYLYEKNLNDLPLRTHTEEEMTIHSFWMCSIVLNNASKTHDLRSFLREKEIETRPFFYPANQFSHCKTDEVFPIAELLSSTGINLPSYPSLKDEEVIYIANSVREFFFKID